MTNLPLFPWIAFAETHTYFPEVHTKRVKMAFIDFIVDDPRYFSTVLIMIFDLR